MWYCRIIGDNECLSELKELSSKIILSENGYFVKLDMKRLFKENESQVNGDISKEFHKDLKILAKIELDSLLGKTKMKNLYKKCFENIETELLCEYLDGKSYYRMEIQFDNEFIIETNLKANIISSKINKNKKVTEVNFYNGYSEHEKAIDLANIDNLNLDFAYYYYNNLEENFWVNSYKIYEHISNIYGGGKKTPKRNP